MIIFKQFLESSGHYFTVAKFYFSRIVGKKLNVLVLNLYQIEIALFNLF